MNDMTLRTLLENAEAWPDEDRQELVDYARIIEARRKGVYLIDESERVALDEALEQAEKGEFASEAMLAESTSRFSA